MHQPRTDIKKDGRGSRWPVLLPLDQDHSMAPGFAPRTPQASLRLNTPDQTQNPPPTSALHGGSVERGLRSIACEPTFVQ